MNNRKGKRSERGIALLMCLLALLLLTSIGFGLMFMANTETAVNRNYRLSMAAYYAAKAGLEEGRDRLRTGFSAAVSGTQTYSITPPSGIPSSTNANGVVYILNTTDASGDPVVPNDASNRYYDDELCNEPFFNGANNSLFPGFTPALGVPCSNLPPAGSFTTYVSKDSASATGPWSSGKLGYKWVRITTKQNCTSYFGVDGVGGSTTNCISTSANKGVQVCADPNDLVNGVPREKLLPTGATSCREAYPELRPVYIITSLAASRLGSRRMTQYEVANVTLPPLPGALTLDGPTPTVNVDFPNSNANRFDGNDHSTPGCTAGPARPAIATIDNVSNNNVITSLDRPANYTGAGTTPSVQTATLPTQYATVGALQTLVANITAGADQVFGNNPSGVNLGTDASPQVTVVNGDYNMGNSHGAGLLLVTGTFTSQGNPDFNGVILVIGKGIANLGGGGNGSFNGGMFIANLYDSTNNLLPPNSIPGSPTFTWAGGGTFDFNYSSCWINDLAGRLPYKVIATREEMY